MIVLSTREEAKTRSDAFTAGANDYLVKLPDRIELIARIRNHTRAYVRQLQRDEAYRALRESQRQLMEANPELQRLMNMDGLTGLDNRRRFDEYAQAQWLRAVREHISFSVLIIDVDDFKRYNDIQGHLAGDQVLKRVATAIQSSCGRPADLAARLGGEEFALVLPGNAAEGARCVGERILGAVATLEIAHPAASTGNHLTLSVGGMAAVPAPRAPCSSSSCRRTRRSTRPSVSARTGRGARARPCLTTPIGVDLPSAAYYRQRRD